MREILLHFVYGVCFPLASSILLKCSKLYSSTRVLGKYSNSRVPQKGNIAENYFSCVHFMQKLLITIFNDSVFNYNDICDILNVFHFLYDIQLMIVWISIEYFEKYFSRFIEKILLIQRVNEIIHFIRSLSRYF